MRNLILQVIKTSVFISALVMALPALSKSYCSGSWTLISDKSSAGQAKCSHIVSGVAVAGCTANSRCCKKEGQVMALIGSSHREKAKNRALEYNYTCMANQKMRVPHIVNNICYSQVGNDVVDCNLYSAP
jgi:hypothetical protein